VIRLLSNEELLKKPNVGNAGSKREPQELEEQV
jgi:hypothetical protein